MSINIGRRPATAWALEIPPELGTAKPDAFDFQHRNRLRQSEVKRDRADEGRVAHASAVAIAFDHEAFPYGNLVGNRSLRAARIPGHIACPHARELLLPEPVDHVVDRFALAGRALR